MRDSDELDDEVPDEINDSPNNKLMAHTFGRRDSIAGKMKQNPREIKSALSVNTVVTVKKLQPVTPATIKEKAKEFLELLI
jgi:hypothetical protein